MTPLNPYWAAGAARIAPVAAAAAAVAWLSAWRGRGSIAAIDWLPAGLVLALLLVTVLASGAAVRPSRTALAALGGALALSVWTGLSLLWTPLPSLARDEVLLTVVYLLAFALPLVLLRGRGERLAAVGAVGAVAVAVALATGIELATSGNAAAHFAIGRLEFPISYANAQAAVVLIGLWPCLAVAAARGAPALVRAASLAGAAALLGTWLATQSKGGGIGLVVSALVIFSLSPSRLRLAVPALLVAACTAVAAAPLTEPYRADDASLQAASAGAGRALLLLAAGAALLGLAYASADRRIELGAAGRRFASRAAAIGVVALVASVGVVSVAELGRPDRALADGWKAFSTYHTGKSGQSHLVSLGGSNRYDFWRVSLEGAREHPVAGIGARGFQAEYLRYGRSSETPARAHSLVLETLVELGIVGFLLLLAALVPALALAARAVRRDRLWAVGALGGCSGWLAHASVDWTWTFAAAGVPFFLLLGIGASAGRRGSLPRGAARAGTAAGVIVAVVLLAPAWLADRLVARALDRPARASADLRLARRLDPVTVRPLVAQAQLAPSPASALAPLRRAAEREPRSIGVRYLYGIRLLEAGRPGEARRELEAALALKPREPLVVAALARARAAASAAADG